MLNIFKTGDLKTFHRIITSNDVATFDSGTVHEVYSTFSIARDAEWSGRLFVLEMLAENEEGIGVTIAVNHHAPAFVGEEITFIATFKGIDNKGNIITEYEAFVKDRKVASGLQSQRILPKDKISHIFNAYKNS
jgi:fluoroacetyl-CoA thioesterase